MFMNNVQFISNIKDLCKKQGFTMVNLLENCSLRKSFVYDVEKRNHKPSIENIEKIAEFLNVSIDYLVGRTDKPNLDTPPATEAEDKKAELSENENESELLRVYRSLSPREKHELMSVVYEMEDKNDLERDREKYVRYDVG